MKCLRLAVELLVCLCVGVHVTSAQVIDLSSSSGRRVVDGPSAGVRAGAWLAVGDVTGDYWHKELIAGTPDESGGRGTVRVFINRPQAAQSMLTSADVVLTGAAAGDRFGSAVDAGYVIQQEVQVVNGSPVVPIPSRDLIVGAPGAQGGRGVVYVFAAPFAAGSTRPASAAAYIIIGHLVGDNLGSLIETADLNGDRHRELVLAVPSRGVIYVVDLKAVTTTVVDLSLVPPAMHISGVGSAMALATGDVTGDGVFDLAVGDPDALGSRGAVYLVRGRVGPLPTTLVPAQIDTRLAGIDAGDRFGAALAIADIDVFRDASAELLIGAPTADGPANTRPDAGEVSVVLGRPDIATAFTPALTLMGAAPGDRLGTQLTAGFVTRRTPADIVMLAAGANGGNGEVFAYFGRDRSVLPRGAIDMATSANRRIVSDETAGPIQSVRVWEVTGEGAEEIVVGVPTAMSTAGRLYIALSPRLDLSATSVSLRAMQCVPATREITINNPSMIAVPWQLSSAPAWIQTSPPNGTTVLGAPGRFQVVVDTTGLPPGTHSSRIEFSSRGPDLSYGIPFDVQITVDPPSRLARNAHVDFTADGCGDIAIFRPSTGKWYVRGRPEVRLGGSGDVPVAGDYNGDLTADLAVYRPSNGTWYFESSEIQWGQPGDVPVPADYNGDGRMDVAVYRPSTGIWYVQGQAPVDWGGASAIPVPADYDGDGRADMAVFLRSTASWRIRNQSTVSWGEAGDLPVPADYDGDGRDDIAVYRRRTGTWFVRNQFTMAWGAPSDVPIPMDMNRDGRAELVVYRRANATWYFVDSATGVSITTPWGGRGDLPWAAARASFASPADFDSDGRRDVAIYRPGTGIWYVLQSSSSFSAGYPQAWGSAAARDVPVPADYDGDLQHDVAVWRPGDGMWHLLIAGGTQVFSTAWGAGSAGDIPVPADYDGDRRADLAVWRPSSGAWFILKSSSAYREYYVVNWGVSSLGDIPVPADYDGDGRTDFAVWRPATGGWHVLTATNNYLTFNWGLGAAGDRPVVADYDGDGRADYAVWRPGDGTWYVRMSSNGSNYSEAWGAGSQRDVPIIGDFDGDGRADPSVWRPANGVWYARFSAGGVLTVQWGSSAMGDVPIGAVKP